MKFIRRHDLDPRTRIEMVKLAWLHQGIYGKMTQIAQDYHISRTFLYQLTWAAQHQLETLFSEPISLAPGLQSPLEPLMLLLRLEAACSIPNPSKPMDAPSLPPSRCHSRPWWFISAMRFLPSDAPSWSRLRRTVRPSSKSSWLPIARPRLGKLILQTLALTAFTVSAWPRIGGLV